MSESKSISPEIDLTAVKVASETGAIRSDASGKGRLDLLPPWAVLRLAKHFEAASTGAEGLISSALRHLLQYLGGDRSEPHEVSAAWNVMVLLETVHRVESGLLPSELMDIPTSDRMQETVCGEAAWKSPRSWPPVCPACGSRVCPQLIEHGYKCRTCGEIWLSEAKEQVQA
jgi:hypothetical protein